MEKNTLGVYDGKFDFRNLWKIVYCHGHQPSLQFDQMIAKTNDLCNKITNQKLLYNAIYKVNFKLYKNNISKGWLKVNMYLKNKIYSIQRERSEFSYSNIIRRYGPT